MLLRSELQLGLQKELLCGKWLRAYGSEGGGWTPEDGPDVKWRMGELPRAGESERAGGVKAGVMPAMALGCFPPAGGIDSCTVASSGLSLIFKSWPT